MSKEEVEDNIITKLVDLRHGERIHLEYKDNGNFLRMKVVDAVWRRTAIDLTQEELSDFIGLLVTAEGSLIPSKIL